MASRRGQLCTAMKPSVYLNTSLYPGPQWGEPPLPRSGFIVLAIIMALFTGLAIVLNATVIIVSLMHKQLRQPLNYALVNMAVADLGTAMTGGLLSVVNNAQGQAACWKASPCPCAVSGGPLIYFIFDAFTASKTFSRLHFHCSDLTFADLLLGHGLSLHGCSHRSGEICSFSANLWARCGSKNSTPWEGSNDPGSGPWPGTYPRFLAGADMNWRVLGRPAHLTGKAESPTMSRTSGLTYLCIYNCSAGCPTLACPCWWSSNLMWRFTPWWAQFRCTWLRAAPCTTPSSTSTWTSRYAYKDRI